jgi:predicted secreted protein
MNKEKEEYKRIIKSIDNPLTSTMKEEKEEFERIIQFLDNPLVSTRAIFKKCGIVDSYYYKIKKQGFINPKHKDKILEVIKSIKY